MENNEEALDDLIAVSNGMMSAAQWIKTHSETVQKALAPEMYPDFEVVKQDKHGGATKYIRADLAHPHPPAQEGDAAIELLDQIIGTLELVISDIKGETLASGPVKNILEATIIRIDAAKTHINTPTPPHVEAVKTITMRVPEDKLEFIDKIAKQIGKTRTQFITDSALEEAALTPESGGNTEALEALDNMVQCFNACMAQYSPKREDDPNYRDAIASFAKKAKTIKSALTRPVDVWKPTHKHLKSGGEYKKVGAALVQSDIPLKDEEEVIVYESISGMKFVRPPREFNDGRFEEIHERYVVGEK